MMTDDELTAACATADGLILEIEKRLLEVKHRLAGPLTTKRRLMLVKAHATALAALELLYERSPQ